MVAAVQQAGKEVAVKVKMLVGGAIDSKPFEAGDKIELDDATAESWVEQGLAEMTDVVKNRTIQLEALTVAQLKDLAVELDIPGRSTLTIKADLIAAIIDAEGGK